MLRSSKIKAIAEWHLLMATIFEFIYYHVHVAGWLGKWPKWAIGSTSAARPGTWHVRKSPDNVNIWYRDLSGKRYGIQCPENIGPASTCLWGAVSGPPSASRTPRFPNYEHSAFGYWSICIQQGLLLHWFSASFLEYITTLTSHQSMKAFMLIYKCSCQILSDVCLHFDVHAMVTHFFYVVNPGQHPQTSIV